MAFSMYMIAIAAFLSGGVAAVFVMLIKTAHGTTVIHTTSNHLFWDPAARKWVKAARLRHGEPLKTADGTTAVAEDGVTPK
jgi:hypothetical protein